MSGPSGLYKMSYKQYTANDDNTTISFWIIVGGIVASIVLKSFVFMLFSIVLCYMFLRTDSNMEAGKPYWTPGKFSRHLQDSYIRNSKGRYNGSGYRSKKRSRRN